MVLKICKYPCLPGNSMIQRLTDYLGVSREPVVLVETILNAVYPPKGLVRCAPLFAHGKSDLPFRIASSEGVLRSRCFVGPFVDVSLAIATTFAHESILNAYWRNNWRTRGSGI